jgi:hypothetical protein
MQKTLLCAVMVVFVLAGCVSGPMSSDQRASGSLWFEQPAAAKS